MDGWIIAIKIKTIIIIRQTAENFDFYITHADDSRGSKTFIRVYLCVSVCLSAQQNQKLLKLQSRNLPQA